MITRMDMRIPTVTATSTRAASKASFTACSFPIATTLPIQWTTQWNPLPRASGPSKFRSPSWRRRHCCNSWCSRGAAPWRSLADTVHNFSDALTAVPLWIAFILSRRMATRTYTYGFGRAEDLAGLFIVAMIALSAVVAAVESVIRLFEPQPVSNLGWVLAAGLIGFAGNEIVAVYRIRVGREIGSAALVADGLHARTDGFTSLAVVAGVIGIWLGFPLADPIIGLLIAAAIFVLLWGTARDIGRRLLDGVDPDLLDRAEAAIAPVAPASSTVRLRWSGHRLHVEVTAPVDPEWTMADLSAFSLSVEQAVRAEIRNAGSVVVVPR